jgi:predicted CXXCH cytochrome family protein
VVEPIVEGLYHADGQQRDEVYVHGSFLQSRMHAAGVTCSDCHDPHSQRLRAPGNQLCAGCHAASRYDAASHTWHAAGSAGAQCVACHMPATTYMGIDPRRDHGFQVPRPDRSVAIGVPNACSGCHTDRTPAWAADALRARLGRDAAGFQQFAEAFAAADRGAPGAAGGLRAIVEGGQPAIVRASALARLRNDAAPAAREAARAGIDDPDSLVRWRALAVLHHVPPREGAPLAAPLLADARRSVRMQAAWLLAPVAGLLAPAGREAFERASAEFVQSQRYNADRAENRLALGLHFAQLGRRADAAAEYRAGLTAWPAYPPAYVSLADLMRLDGREAGAQEVLREGLTAAPDDPSLHHALALSLIRSGEAAQAIEPLARAAALGPDRPEFVYAYAVALNGAGRAREAIQTLERARDRHPQHPEILFALATFLRDAGDLAAAVQYAEHLARTGDPRGPALLQSLR